MQEKSWRFTPAECEEIEEGIYRLKSELETLNTPFYLEEGTLEFLLWYLENTPEEFLEEDPIVEVLRMLWQRCFSSGFKGRGTPRN
jgi:hypothetical protein